MGRETVRPQVSDRREVKFRGPSGQRDTVFHVLTELTVLTLGTSGGGK